MTQHSKQEVNWEFLLASSKSTLQAYEQSRLNFAANVRKEISHLLDTWVDESSSALLARWLIERNLAAEAGAISTNGANGSNGSSESAEQRTHAACVSSGAPKPPSRIAPRMGAEPRAESDKILGESSYTTQRIGVAS